jgi:hypothetical protein
VRLYDDCEQWGEYLKAIRAMVDRPIICTEFGGPNVNRKPADNTYQAKRLVDYIQILDQVNIRDADYFKLVE